MRKLKLDLEALDVESFAADHDAVEPLKGTVRGHASERFCPHYPDTGGGTGTIESGPVLCSNLQETSYGC
ncbi:MAG TPA: hypothetical protein VFS20_12340 [Longimicrobium sp.]|nr:hypothetical protein [Longimicrobium sp.]